MYSKYVCNCSGCMFKSRCYDCEDIISKSYGELKTKHPGRNKIINITDLNRDTLYYKFRHSCVGRFSPFQYAQAKSAIIISTENDVFAQIWLCDLDSDHICDSTYVYMIPLMGI